MGQRSVLRYKLGDVVIRATRTGAASVHKQTNKQSVCQQDCCAKGLVGKLGLGDLLETKHKQTGEGEREGWGASRNWNWVTIVCVHVCVKNLVMIKDRQ